MYRIYMWIAKIKYDSKKTLIGSNALKHNISVFGFPISNYKQAPWIFVNVVGTMFGNEANKNNFIKSLKKEKRVLDLEVNGDFVIGTIKDPDYMHSYYDKGVFHVAPAFISNEGYQIVSLGSFNRELLMKITDDLEKEYNGELLSIKNKNTKSISIVKMEPELTKKQKDAISLAIRKGYYNVPRKISVDKLAEIAKLSFSTFQVHLRKAESKLIPFFFE